jgi:hypothetical protein
MTLPMTPNGVAMESELLARASSPAPEARKLSIRSRSGWRHTWQVDDLSRLIKLTSRGSPSLSRAKLDPRCHFDELTGALLA